MFFLSLGTKNQRSFFESIHEISHNYEKIVNFSIFCQSLHVKLDCYDHLNAFDKELNEHIKDENITNERRAFIYQY